MHRPCTVQRSKGNLRNGLTVFRQMMHFRTAFDRYNFLVGFSHILPDIKKFDSSFSTFLVFKDLFYLYLKGRFYKERRNIEVFHLLVHASTAGAEPMQIQELGLRNFFWVSYVGVGFHSFGHPSLLSQSINGKMDQKWSSWDRNWHPKWDAGAVGLRINLIHQCASSISFYFCNVKFYTLFKNICKYLTKYNNVFKSIFFSGITSSINDFGTQILL